MGEIWRPISACNPVEHLFQETGVVDLGCKWNSVRSEFQPCTCGCEVAALCLLNDVEQAIVVHIDTLQSGT